jgi:hypothetical protein
MHPQCKPRGLLDNSLHYTAHLCTTLSARAQRRLLLLWIFCGVVALCFIRYLSMFSNIPFPEISMDEATFTVPTLNFSSSPILLVSAFFPLPAAKHTDEEYAAWLTRFLAQITTPLVIYTTSSFAPHIIAIRGQLPIVVDTQFNSPFDVPPLRKMQSVYEVQHDTLDPEKQRHSAPLYATWNAKAWLLEDAASRYASSSTQWCFWSDAGALREAHAFREWPNIERVEDVFQSGSETRNIPKSDLFFVPIYDAPTSSSRIRYWSATDGPMDLPMMSEGKYARNAGL